MGVTTGSYSGTRAGPSEPGQCYSASNDAQAYPGGYPDTKDTPPIGGGPWTSSEQCAPLSPPPPPPPNYCNPDNTSPDCMSPIVIDLGRGGYRLSGIEDPVSFDIDASGSIERLSWTERDAPMAFLALDRNSNAVIDNGAELFGNHTPLLSGSTATNGFEALKEYDSNADSVVDSRDKVWPTLLLWVDLDHDGVSRPSEIVPIASSGVTALEYRYHFTGRRDSNGNMLRYASHVHFGNVVQPYYDVYFARAR